MNILEEVALTLIDTQIPNKICLSGYTYDNNFQHRHIDYLAGSNVKERTLVAQQTLIKTIQPNDVIYPLSLPVSFQTARILFGWLRVCTVYDVYLRDTIIVLDFLTK